MLELVQKYFNDSFLPFIKSFTSILNAILKCSSANTYQIARQMSKDNGKSFKTNEMAIYRFLKNSNFKIDDSFFRRHVKLVFDMLISAKQISKDRPIQINVDFTSHKDNFLILSASVLLDNKAIMLYFTTRMYPRKKNQMSQVKMEKSFINGLNHLLSNKYKYIIVADRGFGNDRFAKLCEKNNFDYVLRINPNLNIKVGNKISKLENIKKDKKFEARVVSWQADRYVEVCTKDNQIWYLMSNRGDLDQANLYKKRFKIEKNFQDMKSSGYDLESNKIRKYDKFRRLFYLLILSHGITCYMGYMVMNSKSKVKKNSFALEDLIVYLISVTSEWELKFFPAISKSPLEGFGNLSALDHNVGE